MEPTHRVTLPLELYRLIICHLCHDKDRITLCNIALGASALRDESQRVLFGATTGPHWVQRDLRNEIPYLQTHLLFLESILSSPDRLATYVHTYVRDAHEWMRSDADHPMNKVIARTPGAFAAMINLKRLAFGNPYNWAGRDGETIATYTFDECTFRLESLEWNFIDDSDPPYAARGFLNRQAQLKNLCVYEWPLSDVSSFRALRAAKLPPYSCVYSVLLNRPQLAIMDLTHFEILPPTLTAVDSNVLRAFLQVRYVSVFDPVMLRLPKFGDLWRNVVLLRVSLEKIQRFVSVMPDANLPNLAVLIIYADKYSWLLLGAELVNTLAISFFERWRTLQYVDLTSERDDRHGRIRRYLPLPSQDDSTGCCHIEERAKTVDEYYWWHGHDEGVSEDTRASIGL